MESAAMPKSSEADQILASRADERLAHAYAQIAGADEQLARLTEQLARLEQESARRPQAVPVRKPSRGRPVLRGLIGLLAAACIAGVAFVIAVVLWRRGEARHRPVGWFGFVVAAGKAAAGRAAGSSQAFAWPRRTARLPPTTLLAQAGPQGGAAPTPALTPAELAQLLQTMARDLTTVQQGIEQLKASQEQLTGDNAKIAEQFRASQEQMTRLVAKVSEQEQRARPPAPAAAAATGRRAGAQACACSGRDPDQSAAGAIATHRSNAEGGIAGHVRGRSTSEGGRPDFLYEANSASSCRETASRIAPRSGRRQNFHPPDAGRRI